MSKSMATKGVAVCLLLVMGALASCTSSPQVKAARFIEAGKKFLKKNDASRAILQFQNAVKATPQDPDAYYQLAMGYLAAGDAGHTVGYLRKALELNPKHQASELMLTKLMAEVDDKSVLEDARKRLQALLEEAPDDADVLHTLALTELKLGESEDALRNLDRAIAAAPQSVAFAITLAKAKMQRNDFKGAEDILKQAATNSPKAIDAAMALGQLYVYQKRLPEAVQKFQQALTMDPANSNALFNLGIVQYQGADKNEAEQTFRKLSRGPEKRTQGSLAAFFFEEGRKDDAVRELERLVKGDPADRRARTWLVNAYLSTGRNQAAEKLLNDALAKNSKDTEALLQRGEMALTAKNFKQAETDLNRVLQLQPTAPEVHYILAKLYKARMEDLRYRQELAKVLELNPYLLAARLELSEAMLAGNSAQAALDNLDNAPTAQKGLPVLAVQRNWALWAKADMAEMRKGIDRGLAAGKSPELLLQDGLWKLRSGNTAGARSALESALNINPGDIRALSALRQAMVQGKQSAAGLREIREYAAKLPKSAPVQEFLGAALAAEGLNEEAKRAFLAAKAADPQSVSSDFSLVQLDVAAKNLSGGEHQLNDLLSAHGENATARLWLGNLQEMKGDHSAALQNFRKSVQVEPGNAQALNNLAYLLSEQANNQDEALKYARRAVEMVPDRPAYCDTLGWVLYRKGLYSQAIQYLQRAADDKSRPAWTYHLAMAFAKSGDLARGRTIFQTAWKQDPNSPLAKQAQDVIKGN
jgi:tetratricopeptide (TPR) repeat protein